MEGSPTTDIYILLARPFIPAKQQLPCAPQSHMEYSNEALTAIDVSEPKKALPVPELPPARFGLGIGSPEDSLQNCLRLVPKPPKRDHYRWQKLVSGWLLVLALGCLGCARGSSSSSDCLLVPGALSSPARDRQHMPVAGTLGTCRIPLCCGTRQYLSPARVAS